MQEKKVPPLQDYEDFKRRVLALPKDRQIAVLKKAFDLVYDKLDSNIWRVMATAIKQGKDEGLEGHEDFQIKDEDLKRLSHIQDTFRKQGKSRKK